MDFDMPKVSVPTLMFTPVIFRYPYQPRFHATTKSSALRLMTSG